MIDKSKFKMVFKNDYCPDIHIITIGIWNEGQKVKVIYSKDNKQVKEVERRVYNDKDDLYIVISNSRYNFQEFKVYYSLNISCPDNCNYDCADCDNPFVGKH